MPNTHRLVFPVLAVLLAGDSLCIGHWSLAESAAGLLSAQAQSQQWPAGSHFEPDNWPADMHQMPNGKSMRHSDHGPPPNIVNSCQLSSLPLADVSVHGPYPEGHPNHGMHAMSDGLMMAHQEHGATATTPAADLAVARQTLQYMARFQLATPSNSRPLISTVTACSTTQTKWKMTGSKAELLLAICAHTFRSLQTKA